jgi:polysaccharide deacetylase family sporulation protein PdaB
MRVLIVKRKHFLFLLSILLISLVAINAREKIVDVITGSQKPIYSVKTATKQIAITFDISWGEQNVAPILKILDEEKVHATFFLSSPWAEKEADLVKTIVSHGHEIGSHGRRHVDMNTMSQAELGKELDLSKSTLENLTGQKITLLRPPNGAYDNQVITIARARGYRVIQWSVDSLDWKRPGPDAVINNVINGRAKNKGAAPGDILLFHASDSAPDTPKALPTILRTLKSRNYELVPVGKLLENAQESWPPGSSLQ